MLLRLLKADLARGRAVAAVLVALVALAATLASASASLIIDTVSAVDRLSERARVPDLVQMHTGEADSRAIAQWADSRADVEDYMVMRTLPVPRAQLSIGGAVQAASYLEPAFVTAPERIDLLLDENGERVLPDPGQVYLPIHYKAAGLAEAGDTVTADTGEWRIDLRVAGFLRDAQMNAAMVPSKRLVVNPEDFSSLDEHIAEPEYLIEFDLVDGASAAAVSEEYKAAGLPSTGIAVTAAQIQLMNALSTMLIAAVALVVAGVLAAVAVLALRYTVLAALETDLPQVAVLKAIGAPQTGIRRLYLVKYAVIAAVGGGAGYALSRLLASSLEAPTTLYLGTPPTTVGGAVGPVLVAAGLVAVVVGSAWLVLRRLGRISAVEALRSGTSGRSGRPRRRWRLSRARLLRPHAWLGVREALRPANALLLGVLALCAFTAVLPMNVSTTLADPRSATYLGVGQADLRVDARAGVADIEEIAQDFAADPRIAKQVVIMRRDYTMLNKDGAWASVLIDIGDHSAFPVNYMSGRAPLNDQEIALSHSQAAEAGAAIGTTVAVKGSQGERNLAVVGVYQDITNNGLTAKAVFDDSTPALWQLMYADVAGGEDAREVAQDLAREHPGAQIVEMGEYASQFFGATQSQVDVLAAMALVISLGLAFLITALYSVLVLARERGRIAVLRALGSAVRSIAGQYFTRFGVVAAIGVVLGVAMAMTAGEWAMGLVLASRGAPDLHLLADPLLIGVVVPTALLSATALAVGLALRPLPSITLTDTD
ncbi:ABC transporter permease [Schaalia georgiae]|nr:ABC transporter permease [Schaalia georgiae]